jgi:hypothetical protein
LGKKPPKEKRLEAASPEPATPDFRSLRRRQIRYWCFRFQTEVEGGATAVGAPDGLKAYLEAQPGFLGWRLFAKTFDVGLGPEIAFVPRGTTVWQEWSETLNRVSTPIPMITQAGISGSYERKGHV